MAPNYQSTGRTRQKSRTHDALVAEVRRLIAAGRTPTVDDVARASGISRTTAYRYFPNQHSLLAAAHPEIDSTSLLGADPPSDVATRLNLVLDEHFRILREWEPQLRASLAVALTPGTERPPLRGGRAIGWIAEALEPLRASMPEADVRDLAVRLRAVAGIEPYVWLVDVAGLDPGAALAAMRVNAHAVLAASTEPQPQGRKP